MRESNSFSPLKKTTHRITHNYQRSVKSNRKLQHHLENYQKSYDKQISKSCSKIPKIPTQRSQSIIKKSSLLFASDETPMTHKKPLVDRDFGEKVDNLVENLLLNISIFQKTFATSKRKKLIITKIFGWDNIFDEVFFHKNDEENFKPQLSKKTIIQELNLDKHSFGSKNIYNKLRFFLAQLIDLNFKQQQIQCSFQKQRFTESSAKLLNKFDTIDKTTSRESVREEIEKMKNTHLELFNRKMRIKNRGGQLLKISNETGKVNLDQFFLKEQRNIEGIQKFLKSSLIK